MSTEIAKVAPSQKTTSSKKKAKTERKFSNDFTAHAPSKNEILKDQGIADFANSVMFSSIATVVFLYIVSNGWHASNKMFALLVATFFGILYPLGMHNMFHYEKTWFGFPRHTKFITGEDGLIPNFLRYAVVHTSIFVGMLISSYKFLSPMAILVSSCFHMLAVTENCKPNMNKTYSMGLSLVSKLSILAFVFFGVPTVSIGSMWMVIPLASLFFTMMFGMSVHLPWILISVEIIKQIFLLDTTVVGYLFKINGTNDSVPMISVSYIVTLVLSLFIREVGNTYFKSDKGSRLFRPETFKSAMVDALVFMFPIMSLFNLNPLIHFILCMMTFTATIETSNFDISKGYPMLTKMGMAWVQNQFM